MSQENRCEWCGEPLGEGTTRCWRSCFTRELEEMRKQRFKEREEALHQLQNHPGYPFLAARREAYWQFLQQPLHEALPLLLGEPCLKELAAEHGVQGCSRFFHLPSFTPDQLVTMVFKESLVHVTVVKAGHPLAEAVHGVASWQGETFPFLGADFWARTKRVYSFVLGSKHHLSGAWTRLWSDAHHAPDCQQPMLDGTTYIHHARTLHEETLATWVNPDPGLHPIQTRWVESHARLLARMF